MTYQKTCDIRIDCYSKDAFFNNKKKTYDTSINLNLNKFIGTKNSFSNQKIELMVDDKKYYVPLYDLQQALKMLKNIHNAGD